MGAAGSELDRVDYALGSPAHTLVLARSFGHSDAYQHVVEEVNTSDSRQGGTENVLVYADMAYLEYPNGGAVFSTSSIAWSGSLSYNDYDNDVSRITENVLRRFAADEPIPWPTGSVGARDRPARVAGWRTIGRSSIGRWISAAASPSATPAHHTPS